MNIKFISSGEKKKLLRELNEKFGISKLPYLLFETGKEKIRGFSGTLLSRLDNNGNKLNIDVGAGDDDLCPSCNNGLQDSGEEGLDCGGECGACLEASYRFGFYRSFWIFFTVSSLILISLMIYLIKSGSGVTLAFKFKK